MTWWPGRPRPVLPGVLALTIVSALVGAWATLAPQSRLLPPPTTLRVRVWNPGQGTRLYNKDGVPWKGHGYGQPCRVATQGTFVAVGWHGDHLLWQYTPPTGWPWRTGWRRADIQAERFACLPGTLLALPAEAGWLPLLPLAGMIDP